MEKYRPLNTTDEWEEIVNENAKRRANAEVRVAARERANRINKMWIKAFAFAMTSLAFAIFGMTGIVANLLATAISLVTLVLASVQLGKFLEAVKR